MAEQHRQMAAIEDPQARRRLGIHFAQIDARRLSKIRSVTAKGVVPILLPDRVIEYFPATGQFRWARHPNPDLVGKDPVFITKEGTRVISLPNGGNISAARMAHEAVHGESAEGEVVCCINNDQSDLRLLNLRSYPRKSAQRVAEEKELDEMLQQPVEIPDELRAKLRAAREAREARNATEDHSS